MTRSSKPLPGQKRQVQQYDEPPNWPTREMTQQDGDANNTAVDEGGAIYGSSNSDMDFKFVTIANNSARYGGAIARYGPATVRFYNTILANNGENGNCWIVDPKVTALPMSLGFNLSSDDDEDSFPSVDKTPGWLLLLIALAVILAAAAIAVLLIVLTIPIMIFNVRRFREQEMMR